MRAATTPQGWLRQEPCQDAGQAVKQGQRPRQVRADRCRKEREPEKEVLRPAAPTPAPDSAYLGESLKTQHLRRGGLAADWQQVAALVSGPLRPRALRLPAPGSGAPKPAAAWAMAVSGQGDDCLEAASIGKGGWLPPRLQPPPQPPSGADSAATARRIDTCAGRGLEPGLELRLEPRDQRISRMWTPDTSSAEAGEWHAQGRVLEPRNSRTRRQTRAVSGAGAGRCLETARIQKGGSLAPRPRPR
jgi:hypothetical protein